MPPRPPIPSPSATCPPPPLAGSSAAHSRRHLANILSISGAIAAAVLLLSLTYFAVLRRRPRPVAAVHGRASGGGESPVHHVWLVRTVGLDDVAIEAIGVEAYKAGDEVANDCAVCLAEFEDGELVRLLPKCGHAFHVACIDPWLRAHVNCPLCRALIVDSVDNSADLGEVTEMPRIETVELGEETNQEELEVRIPIGVGEESEFPPESSSPGSEVGSGSMESAVGDGLVVVVEGGGSVSEEEKDCRRWNSGNSSKGGPDGKANSDIERSSSSNARGFFFLRH